MTELLGGQIDYVYFAQGLAFVMVAATARALAWRPDQRFAWTWLAVSGLGVGLYEWLGVFSLALGPNLLLTQACVGLLLASSLALLEFCRRSARLSRLSPWWGLVPAAVVAAAAAGGHQSGAEAAIRYLLVLPGAAWASWLCLDEARRAGPDAGRLRQAGIAFALVAVTSGLAVSAAVPVHYARALAAALLAHGLWTYYCGVGRASGRVMAFRGWNRYENVMKAATLLVIVAGWAFTELTTRWERGQSYDSLRARAATVAAAFPPALIDRLAQDGFPAPADVQAEVRRMLEAVCAASPDVMSAAMVARQGGSFFYVAQAIPESRRPGGGRPANPGDRYRGPEDALVRLLDARITSGSRHELRDTGGSLSNLVPILLPSGEAIGVLDLRVDPADRRQAVERARLSPILVTLLTSLLLMAFFVTERKMTESAAGVVASQAALETAHRFTQVILAISARFLNLRAERVDAATREALREVGTFLGVDRAQLFHISPDRTSFSLTHEWCKPGTASRLADLQAVCVGDYPWLWSLLEQPGLVRVRDVNAMPEEAKTERARMSTQAIGAFLCVPVHRRGQVTGFLGLDVFGRQRDWPDGEVALLRIVADVLSNGLARKVTDEALRESEQRFQRAFRNNPAPMAIVWTENRRIVEVNEAFLVLADRRLEQVVGRTVEETGLIDGDGQGRLSAAIGAGESLRHLELRIRTGTGEQRHVSLSMDAFELAGQTFMLAVALDLSARVLAEETLREREEIFRSISAAAQDGIIMIDSDGRVTVWNDAAERMFGYRLDEAEGQPLQALIMPEDYEAGFMEGFGHFRRSGEGPFIGTAQQVMARRKDGTQIPVELSASAVNVRGRWHAVGILRDITDRLKVEEELWKAKEETEAANAELQRSVERAKRLADEAAIANAYKSEFLANMSHEIRTPMNGIIGMTGLLIDTNLSADQLEYAETVRSCADSLLTIINDILDFSKIEAGKLDLETLDFDLGSVLEGTVDVLAMRADQKGLALGCSVAPDVPQLLRGDPGRVRQIVTNLIGNAIKFTAAGEVALSVALEETQGDHVLLRFVVRDTGIGIPAAKVDSLFQPFTQVDASTTRKFGGTGLGLSISRRLAEMMGGSIGVESEEGVGSRFWFTARFDRQPEQAASAADGAVAGARPGATRPAGEETPVRKARVLLAEDNITNQKVAIKVLEKMGHRVDAVANGVEAIKALRTMPYDLVFMDVQMPEMDGFEATRRIRDPQTGVRNPRIPIVAMTAHAMKGDRERCLDAGMDDYVSKPIDPRDVAAAIARRLPSETADARPSAPNKPAPAPPPASDGRAGLDPGLPDRASLLNRLGGDEEMFVEIIKIFLEDVPKQLAGMDTALAAGDARTLRRLAHTLKGSSGTAGAAALQQASLALETAAASGDLVAAAPLIAPVKDLFAVVLDTMSRWVAPNR
jgi:PAS domain S-box-containing protein